MLFVVGVGVVYLFVEIESTFFVVGVGVFLF